MKTAIASILSVLFFSLTANATTIMKCDPLPGLIGEGSPIIISVRGKLYVKMSMSEQLNLKTAPDQYESASFKLKFNSSWTISNRGQLSLKGTEEISICRPVS